MTTYLNQAVIPTGGDAGEPGSQKGVARDFPAIPARLIAVRDDDG
jgi:hypothetical protein